MQRRFTFWWVLAGTTGLLLLTALYLRLAPVMAETRWQSVTLATLKKEVAAHPDTPAIFYYYGLRLADIGRIGPAQAALAQATKLAPDDERFLLAYARLLSDAEKYGDTQQALKAFLITHPENVAVRQEMALLYLSQDEPVPAWAEAQTLRKASPKTGAAWRVIGLAALQNRKFTEAQAAFTEAVRYEPNSFRNQLALGDANLATNRTPDAIVAYKEAVRLAPQSGIALTTLARAELTNAKTDADREIIRVKLEKATELTPDYAPAFTTLGTVQSQLGQWPEAKKALKASIALDPNNQAVYYQLKRVCENSGDKQGSEEAQANFEQVRKFEAERDLLLNTITQVHYDSATAMRLANLCATNQDYALARPFLRRLRNDANFGREATALLAEIEARPRPATLESSAPTAPTEQHPVATLFMDAEALVKAGHRDEAKAAYETILRQNPPKPDLAHAYEGIGLLALPTGNLSETFPPLFRASEFDPTRPETQYGLAMAYYNAGFVDEARKRMETLVANYPNQAKYHNGLGNCIRMEDPQRKRAQGLYEKATQLAPDNAEYWRNLANIEDRLGKHSEAEAHFRHALTCKTDNFPELPVSLASHLLQYRNTPEGLAEAEKLLIGVREVLPQSRRAALALGRVYLQEGKASNAIPLLEQAVMGNPREREQWFLLARAYDRLGNRERATFCHNQFTRLQAFQQNMINTEEQAQTSPKNTDLRLKLARMYAEYGDYARALNQYDVCIQKQPQNTTLKKERDTLRERLIAGGEMPPMGLFEQMLTRSKAYRN